MKGLSIPLRSFRDYELQAGYSPGDIIQAPSGGFVCAIGAPGGAVNGALKGFCDPFTPPTTVRTYTVCYTNTLGDSIELLMLVPKNHFWKIEVFNSATIGVVWFVPFR